MESAKRAKKNLLFRNPLFRLRSLLDGLDGQSWARLESRQGLLDVDGPRRASASAKVDISDPESALGIYS